MTQFPGIFFFFFKRWFSRPLWLDWSSISSCVKKILFSNLSIWEDEDIFMTSSTFSNKSVQ